MAVTGVADPARLLRNDAAVAGLPISLTKPLGVGVLNNRHKSTGEVVPEAVASMVALNARGRAGRPGRRRGGGHRRHRVRPAGAPVQDGARLRGDRRGRRGRGALPRRRAGGAARRLRQRRHPAQPGLGAVRTSPPTSTRTSCCCSPTPRPAAGCWSWARCPAPRSSGRWSRGRTQSSASAEALGSRAAGGPRRPPGDWLCARTCQGAATASAKDLRVSEAASRRRKAGARERRPGPCHGRVRVSRDRRGYRLVVPVIDQRCRTHDRAVVPGPAPRRPGP